MISDLIYSANAVLPIFITALVGYILKKIGFISDGFISCADKLIFKVMLPCMLFTKVAYTDKSMLVSEDFGLVVFCLAGVLAVTLILIITVPRFIDSASSGAFIQGVFRSNMAILGVPFAQNLFGDQGARIAAIVLACIVPLYNVLAVIVLTVFSPSEAKKSKPLYTKIPGIILGIIKNPLIIGILLAVPFCLFDITLPTFAAKTIGYFADCATPLALLVIGASFKFSDLKGRVSLAVTASLCKTVVLPAIMLFIAYSAFSYTGTYLGLALIAFGTPTAVSSYIMARNMHSDYKLANQIVLLTTLLSSVTIFMWSFVLRQLNLI